MNEIRQSSIFSLNFRKIRVMVWLVLQHHRWGHSTKNLLQQFSLR